MIFYGPDVKALKDNSCDSIPYLTARSTAALYSPKPAVDFSHLQAPVAELENQRWGTVLSVWLPSVLTGPVFTVHGPLVWFGNLIIGVMLLSSYLAR